MGGVACVSGLRPPCLLGAHHQGLEARPRFLQRLLDHRLRLGLHLLPELGQGPVYQLLHVLAPVGCFLLRLRLRRGAVLRARIRRLLLFFAVVEQVGRLVRPSLELVAACILLLLFALLLRLGLLPLRIARLRWFLALYPLYCPFFLEHIVGLVRHVCQSSLRRRLPLPNVDVLDMLGGVRALLCILEGLVALCRRVLLPLYSLAISPGASLCG